MKKARVNELEPVFSERASIRQAHNTRRAASEVAHPSIKDKVLPLAQSIADRVSQQQG